MEKTLVYSMRVETRRQSTASFNLTGNSEGNKFFTTLCMLVNDSKKMLTTDFAFLNGLFLTD